MNSIPRFASLALGLLAAITPFQGDAQTDYSMVGVDSSADREAADAHFISEKTDPVLMVARLDELVTLTSAQKAKATEIFRQEAAGILAVPPAERLRRINDFDWAVTDQIRPLLTADQRQQYDRTPPYEGGGQRLDPAFELRLLERAVTLTPEQEVKAAQIFQSEAQGLIALPPGDKGGKVRTATAAQVRAMLRPEQWLKYDSFQHLPGSREERKFVENLLVTSKALAARVGSVTLLSHQGLTSRSARDAAGTWSRGEFGYKVIGSTGALTLTVYWERSPPTAPIKIIKVQTATGEKLAL